MVRAALFARGIAAPIYFIPVFVAGRVGRIPPAHRPGAEADLGDLQVVNGFVSHGKDYIIERLPKQNLI
ncbi:MAG: hypothetical protein AB9891_06200 [Anaerolineaceae bacterium]